MSFSPVSQRDIDILAANGCCADDWNSVLVSDGFDARRVRRTTFKGEIRLGRFDGAVPMPGGPVCDAGITSASLHNVIVGDNCCISNVNGWLSNLEIGSEALILNVGTIGCTGESSFGNGLEISLLNEGGGRKLKITIETSAQAAYLATLYRDQSELVGRLQGIAADFARSVSNSRATVGKRAHIINCLEITNVRIGECAVVRNVISLRDGTIESTSEAPTVVENGIVAERFVVQKGARIVDGAMIKSSLVGEGAILGRQFSAENSVFFANCEGFHSEAASVFAGPYSVTHHRSTLLIAGMFSFFNAGSGTNQSNHRYKLGPLHQGVLARGCKTGSGAYLVWPSNIGAFSTVIGVHTATIDTGKFPFSFIYRDGGKSFLVAGANLAGVGIIRDHLKWESRDRRTATRKRDVVITHVFSPYTAQAMIEGMELLIDLDKKSEPEAEFVVYNGVHIKRAQLGAYARHYGAALEKYLGSVLVRRIESEKSAKVRDLLPTKQSRRVGNAAWIDVAGLLCEKRRIDQIIEEVVSGELSTFEGLHAAFESIGTAYRDDEWRWFLENHSKVFGGATAAVPKRYLEEILAKWKSASIEAYNSALADATKEFSETIKVGYGVDGNKDSDFIAVRGAFDENELVATLKKSIDTIEKSYATYGGMI